MATTLFLLGNGSLAEDISFCTTHGKSRSEISEDRPIYETICWIDWNTNKREPDRLWFDTIFPRSRVVLQLLPEKGGNDLTREVFQISDRLGGSVTNLRNEPSHRRVDCKV